MTVGNGYYYGNSTSANTIVSGNTATISTNPTVAFDLAFGSTASGTAAFQFSLLGAALSAAFTGNSNVFNDTPGLGALASNGGPTKTMALLAGSPAINAGSNALAVDANSVALTTDQTGAPRIKRRHGRYWRLRVHGDRIFANGFE